MPINTKGAESERLYWAIHPDLSREGSGSVSFQQYSGSEGNYILVADRVQWKPATWLIGRFDTGRIFSAKCRKLNFRVVSLMGKLTVWTEGFCEQIGTSTDNLDI